MIQVEGKIADMSCNLFFNEYFVLANLANLATGRFRASLLLTVISDGFYGATGKRFVTSCSLFVVFRLLVDKGITVLVSAHKIVWGGVAAHITIYAGGVDIVSTRDGLFNLIVSIGQSLVLSSKHIRRFRRFTNTAWESAVGKGGLPPLALKDSQDQN